MTPVSFRCPFCHAAVTPAAEPSVACAACVARHHAECWREHGGCSACGEGAPLRRPPRPRLLAAALLLAAGVASGLGVAALVARPAPTVAGYIELARAARARGDLAAELEGLDRAVALDPRSEPAHRCRALALRDRGDLDGAIVELGRAIGLDPRSAMAWALRGSFLLERGNTKAAVRDLKRSLALSPSLTWAQARLRAANGT